MNVSENIAHLLRPEGAWKFYTARQYTVQIQKADPAREYNVPGQAGVVYNFLEDVCEAVTAESYIVTGLAGELWVIPESALQKYAASPEAPTYAPQPVTTVGNGAVFAAIQIPAETEFYVEADYGEKALLKGNRKGIAHGTGDFVVANTRTENGKPVPELHSLRIVNGALFHRMYQKL